MCIFCSNFVKLLNSTHPQFKCLYNERLTSSVVLKMREIWYKKYSFSLNPFLNVFS